MTTKSKAWNEFVNKVSDILNRMYDTNPQGIALTENSPELMDPINRIANTQIEMNGYYYNPFTEHAARRIVMDELNNRQKKERTN